MDYYLQSASIIDAKRKLNFKHTIPQFKYYLGNNSFSFLNIEHQFEDEINWNYLEYGKLWNYNLQYANWLNQEEFAVDDKLQILKSLQNAIAENKLQLEPYPVSLRSINIIRFIVANNIGNSSVVKHLSAELIFLNNNLEFHILGNHLLENLFALAMGGAFFNNREWVDRATSLLRDELKEQVHKDGAHFELSPMYHQIIFYRLLELNDWYGDYEFQNNSFSSFCRETASKMLSWLNNITFQNGEIPLFNDAAKGIAFTTEQLKEYAKVLRVEPTPIKLSDSGYRSFENEKYEIKIDLAQIGASYQAGHAHADALSFIVHYKGVPLLVEQGTSTYQIGDRRNEERSTAAHNCVVVNGRNQSEVWGGFRTGRRAKTTILSESNNNFSACHDGYKSSNVIHTRSFELNDNEIIIIDELSNSSDAVFYLHFHHLIDIEQTSNLSFATDNGVSITFEGAEYAVIKQYQQSEEYNIYNDASRLKVAFKYKLTCRISF